MLGVAHMLESGHFWLDVLKIIVIDILLSGDNAVVIALACRSLPAAQRRRGILYGVMGAIVLRIVLTAFAAGLLTLPYLKLAGAALLMWIGVKLILPETEHEADNLGQNTRLWGAVRTILLADFIMSLDNVVGVAAAAHGNVLLLVFGLLVSIPLVAWSSQLVIRLIDRFSFIVYLGGGLLGYVGGEMMVSDPLTRRAIEGWLDGWHWLLPAACALGVMALGWLLARRKLAAAPALDLVDEKVPAEGGGQEVPAEGGGRSEKGEP